MNWFDQANSLFNDINTSAVTFASNVAPWLVTIPVMAVTVGHLVGGLEWSYLIAVPAGLVLWLLGLATVHTILSFIAYNQTEKAKMRKIPGWVLGGVVIMFGWYVIAVGGLIVLLEDNIYHMAVQLALFSLEIPAAAIQGARTMQANLATKSTSPRTRVVTRPSAQSSQPLATRSSYTCECGDLFDSKRGLSMHKTRYCQRARVAQVNGSGK